MYLFNAHLGHVPCDRNDEIPELIFPHALRNRDLKEEVEELEEKVQKGKADEKKKQRPATSETWAKNCDVKGCNSCISIRVKRPSLYIQAGFCSVFFVSESVRADSSGFFSIEMTPAQNDWSQNSS